VELRSVSLPLSVENDARLDRPIKVGCSYRKHWKIEHYFAWMDNCRHLVDHRYERYAELYNSFCLIALILWFVDPILK
jgi:hypothetical protein